MSILSDAFDGFVDFVSTVGGNSPQTYGQTGGQIGPPTPPASNSFPSLESVSNIAGPLLNFAGPLISASVTRPPVPERPKFPDVPDSVKNDPRVQNLLGSYGFTNGTMPTMAQPFAPSAFQIAFPTMLNAATKTVNSWETPQAVQQPQLSITQPASISAPQPPTTGAPQPAVIASDPAQTLAQTSVEKISTTMMDAPLAKADLAGVMSTSKYDPLIQEAAKANGIDVNLLRALVQQESNGDPTVIGYAANKAGQRAKGLMQLMPDAAHDAAGRTVTDKELFDPATNIHLGAKYIAQIMKQLGSGAEAAYDKVVTAYYQGVSGSRKSETYAKAKPYRDRVLKRIGDNRKYYQS